MNRRSFLHTFALAAGSATLGGLQAWGREPQMLSLGYRHQKKIPLKISLTSAETKLLRVVGRHSSSSHMFGGPVLSRARGSHPSWVNLLVDSKDFSRMKRKLFEFGVTPLSTPEMPSSFAKFVYEEQVYNVMNSTPDEFCQLNRLQARVQLVPFAHNFLLCDLQRGLAIDPCGALDSQSSSGTPEIVLVAKPRTLGESFDCVLSGRFEAKLLGLSPSQALRDFEQFVLNDSSSKSEVPRIAERVVNYIPDAIEVLGMEETKELVLCPMIRNAIKSGINVELDRVWSKLEKSKEDHPAMFIALLKEAMGVSASATGFEDDLTLYLAKNGYNMRRMDLAADAVMMTA